MTRILFPMLPVELHEHTTIIYSDYHEKLLIGGIVLSFVAMTIFIKKFILKIK